ncbi:MAG: aldo/keto reductase [Oscillospiraceae bacterium]|jgi:aryl-alcohol dehydrogenase-like predicted oxidoreductase|nr:aldo/keto reductase [Oscillospiraceae bacterium]
MQKLKISNDLTLDRLILGSCYFGNGISEEECFAMLDAYWDAGGRTVDTARVYAVWLPGGDASERVIGRWMKTKPRHEVCLVTKGGHPPIDRMTTGRLDRNSLYFDLAASLQALDTDYIDLYILHRDDVFRPVADVMETLSEFVQAGKVRALGASNWSLDRILEANEYAVTTGKTPFSVSQIQWSLAASTPQSWGDETLVCMTEDEYRRYLAAGLPVMAFSSQAKGLFSKYLDGGENALNPKIRARFLTPENLVRAEKVRELCGRSGFSPAAVSLSYITRNPLPAAAILGCSNSEQLKDSLTADGIEAFWF